MQDRRKKAGRNENHLLHMSLIIPEFSRNGIDFHCEISLQSLAAVADFLGVRRGASPGGPMFPPHQDRLRLSIKPLIPPVVMFAGIWAAALTRGNSECRSVVRCPQAAAPTRPLGGGRMDHARRPLPRSRGTDFANAWKVPPPNWANSGNRVGKMPRVRFGHVLRPAWTRPAQARRIDCRGALPIRSQPCCKSRFTRSICCSRPALSCWTASEPIWVRAYRRAGRARDAAPGVGCKLSASFTHGA